MNNDELVKLYSIVGDVLNNGIINTVEANVLIELISNRYISELVNGYVKQVDVPYHASLDR